MTDHLFSTGRINIIKHAIDGSNMQCLVLSTYYIF